LTSSPRVACSGWEGVPHRPGQARRIKVPQSMPNYSDETIANALDGIQQRRYVLPAIQREFVWDADRMCALFDSRRTRGRASDRRNHTVPARAVGRARATGQPRSRECQRRPDRIRQVLINLLDNAVKHGGDLVSLSRRGGLRRRPDVRHRLRPRDSVLRTRKDL